MHDITHARMHALKRISTGIQPYKDIEWVAIYSHSVFFKRIQAFNCVYKSVRS